MLSDLQKYPIAGREGEGEGKGVGEERDPES